jgi:hypothetical protein
MTETNHKERALKKLEVEIHKDIQKLIMGAKKCGVFELLHFMYYLHWSRLLHLFPKAETRDKPKLKIFSSTIEESLKFLISLITKYGKPNFFYDKEKKILPLNNDLVIELLKLANLINAKYENFSMINLFDVTVYGERDRYLRIDMSNVQTDKELMKIFNYFVRTDIDNNLKKNESTLHNELIDNFKKEYLPFNDLFVKEIGVSVNEFCDLINKILNLITERIKEKQDSFPKLENGNVDIQDSRTFIGFSLCYLFDKSELYEQFESKFHSVIKRLTFEPEEFNENELRFHFVTRKPLIEIGKTFAISPELILDSIFTNTHYSLLESPEIKHEYISKQSDYFVDQIVEIANKYGYDEIDRELELYERKNQIGDLDVVLKNQNGHFLIIEAKNHALPLDIYFKDVTKTREHLEYLKDKWESKVIKRKNHLAENHSKYGIGKNHKYIVVSLFPEIISHFSNLLVLSIKELEMYLESNDLEISFEEFYSKLYKKHGQQYSEEEIEELKQANIVLGTYATD